MSYASNALTERQQTILRFVRGFIEENGFSPTIREITDGCGMRTTSVTSYNLDRLAEMGLLTRQPDKARSIVLAKEGATA